MTALLRGHGLLCAGSAISIAPPLVATPADCDELVGRLDEAIAVLEAELGLT